jgi:hypothetical protein
MMAVFPSGEIFLTRGSQSRRFSDAVCRYSSTYRSLPKRATAVGDHGLWSWTRVVTFRSGVTFRTLPHPLAATWTVPRASISSPRRSGPPLAPLPGIDSQLKSAISAMPVETRPLAAIRRIALFSL